MVALLLVGFGNQGLHEKTFWMIFRRFRAIIDVSIKLSKSQNHWSSERGSDFFLRCLCILDFSHFLSNIEYIRPCHENEIKAWQEGSACSCSI